MESNNPSPVPGTEASAAASVGNENVTPAASLKDIVKNLTGREYQSDEDAADGIKNTYQMVGKKVEPQVVEKTVVPDNVVQEVQELKQQLKVSSFYAEHPEFKDVKDVISKFGSDPEQVVQDPVFKKVYDTVKTSATESKSVLNSSSRIGVPQSNDYQADLERARQTGDWVAFMTKHKGLEQMQ